ncbi:hypothetical protein HXX76_003987 [Chlamydomonas incerta]|uniref:Uncharacterized protein n=1 Tax=Chlamydomonas incerta TaxID=51695 RepID=A0A835TLN7_CHLIN|nr:hypothetical protein HXX76_003987 [Chlamydomonas incerta]|eukprot:KAG2441135.1 hypothetical protein HXX76_003987 [Chlamydomonas incerta]
MTYAPDRGAFAHLARWPRATALTLALDDGNPEACEPGCCAADVAMLWLSRQSPAARQTILELELEYAPVLESPWQVAALCTLPLWLPNLKSLDLKGLQGWRVPPEAAAGLVTLFRGLAALPHLQRLSLPHTEMLQHAHHLLAAAAPPPPQAVPAGPGHGAGASSAAASGSGGCSSSSNSQWTPPLRDLYVETLFPADGDLPPQVFGGVAALTCLTRLSLAHLTPPLWSLRTLGGLLAAAPPRLAELSITGLWDLYRSDWGTILSLRLRGAGGYTLCVRPHAALDRDPGIPLGTLGRLARDVLLPCRRLWQPSPSPGGNGGGGYGGGGGGGGGGPTLRVLELPLVTDAEAMVGMGADAVSRPAEQAAAEVAAVRELAARPQLRVAVGTLVLGPASSTESARAVLDALGCRPRELRLLLDRRRCFSRLPHEADGYITLRLPRRSGKRGQQQQQQQQASSAGTAGLGVGSSFAAHAAAAVAAAVDAAGSAAPAAGAAARLDAAAVVTAAADFLERASESLPFWEAAAAEEPDGPPAADAGPESGAQAPAVEEAQAPAVEDEAQAEAAAEAEEPGSGAAAAAAVAAESEPAAAAAPADAPSPREPEPEPGSEPAAPEPAAPEPAAPDVLLLRGPLVSTMARAPSMFSNWLGWLAPAADAAATAAARWNGLHRIPRSPVGTFKLLPGSHPLLAAVLVRVGSSAFSWAGLQAALAPAVEDGAVEVACLRLPQGAAAAATAAARQRAGGRAAFADEDVDEVLLWAVQQVASEVWPGGTGTAPRTDNDTAAGAAVSSATATSASSGAGGAGAAAEGGCTAGMDPAGGTGTQGAGGEAAEEDEEDEGHAGGGGGGVTGQLLQQLQWCVALQAELHRLPLAVELAVR